MSRNTPVILCAFFLCLCLHARGYEHKKVILLAPRASQSDSTGYNFVSDMSSAVYSWIKDSLVVLWDSPEKKTSLSFSALNGIEKNSGTRFTGASNLFIYENWTSTSKKFSSSVKGFSFTGTNAKGEDVLYGYIECNDEVKELMKNKALHLNANGCYGSTLYSALMNMGFQFNLIYFDNSPLQDYRNSAKIVNKSIDPKKKMANKVVIPETRLIEYGWDSSVLAQESISDQVTSILNQFFNHNKQEFYNYGGDKLYSYLRNAQVLITGLRVIQQWTIEKSGKITYTLVAIVPYTVGNPLMPIPAQKLDEWNLKMDNMPLSQYLTEKNFAYTIKKINETVIPAALAENYKNALFAGDWHHLLSSNQTKK